MSHICFKTDEGWVFNFICTKMIGFTKHIFIGFHTYYYIFNIGWKGSKCNFPCRKGFFGKNCSEMCQCSKYASCDPISGFCNCADGYIGIT